MRCVMRMRDKLGMLASPEHDGRRSALAGATGDALGTANIDHRIAPARFFGPGQRSDLSPRSAVRSPRSREQDALLIAGSNLRREAPILAHRVRKAALAGAKVSFANSSEQDYYFDVANYAQRGRPG